MSHGVAGMSGLHIVPHSTVSSFFCVLWVVEALREACNASRGHCISSVPLVPHLELPSPKVRATLKVCSFPAR